MTKRIVSGEVVGRGKEGKESTLKRHGRNGSREMVDNFGPGFGILHSDLPPTYMRCMLQGRSLLRMLEMCIIVSLFRLLSCTCGGW